MIVQNWGTVDVGMSATIPHTASKLLEFPNLVSLSNVVSRKQLATELVIPAKAGIQLASLWIPASAGMTRVGGRADGSPTGVKPYASHYTSTQRCC